MKKYIYLFFICLCLLEATPSFSQDIGKRITFSVRERSLEEILTLLSAEFEVEFSYMNNDLPGRKISVAFQKSTLNEVLDQLLPEFQLEHVDHAGQVIIRKAEAKEIKIIEEPEKITNPAEGATKTKSTIALTKPIETDTISVGSTTVAAKIEPAPIEKVVPDSSDVVIELPLVEADTVVKSTSPIIIRYIPGNDELESDKFTADSLMTDSIPPLKLERKYYHLGLFYPFSTNGPNAGKYLNNFSLHLFAGYSGALDGFEFSGLGNLTRHNMDGVQLAGITNIVKEDAIGIQLAGAVNVTERSAVGLQASLGANVVKESHDGLQVTLGSNVVIGDYAGFQAGGVVNVATGHVKYGQATMGVNVAVNVNGPQAAFLINIQKHKGNGLQAAGFMNQAGDYNGWQAALFMNKARRIKGLQTAGFINVAKSVRGAQIGFINISDSLDGVPIGLFSLVKRNGYVDLEIFYADDFQANAIIKIGAQKFYNIFGFSYETASTHRWAYGYGFGSQWGKHVVRLNTDVMAYYVAEKDFPNGAFRDYELNILSKFRFLGSLHFHNFGVFGGPTFNVMTSRHQYPGSEAIGSTIASKSLYNHTNQWGTNTKIWMGYNLGIRF